MVVRKLKNEMTVKKIVLLFHVDVRMALNPSSEHDINAGAFSSHIPVIIGAVLYYRSVSVVSALASCLPASTQLHPVPFIPVFRNVGILFGKYS